ncbi:hypothetical protein EI164_00830 [Psychrobacter sp. FME13]|uniref:hypothetical protein n=1 Tax=Psychrobacter sp. FME13 TaxID=2487708 RepID=UPI0017883B19|nr:hypothetical protein [Psychrobacter sp. FME13]MBE0440623.1 hypothetical protein [Psychrobacter sp. FME13]
MAQHFGSLDLRSGISLRSSQHFGSLVLKNDNLLYLFADGQQGAWYDPSDKSTLFQGVAGTVPVTKDGDPVALMLDKSGNNNHATQTVSAARPVYKDNLARLSLDKVDDAIVINLPTRLVGTMTIASTTGTATYGVDIPAGNFTLGGSYFSSNNIVGLILREGELSADDESKVDSYLLSKGAVKSFVGITDFATAWYNNNLTSFPLIDTSSGTNFSYAWHGNNLTSFPLIDTSSGTNFATAWYNNNLTSFPLIDTSSGTNFSYAWHGNNLTSFPLIDTSSGTNFATAWYNNNLTSFPLIDTSSGTNFYRAWHGNNLTSFPLIDTSSGTNFATAWYNNNLTSFPLIDTSSGTNFYGAWYNNTSLVDFPENMFDNIKGGNFTYTFTDTNLSQSSIDGILASLVASGIASGTRAFDQSGGSAPSATGQAAIDTLRSRGWTVTVTGGY